MWSSSQQICSTIPDTLFEISWCTKVFDWNVFGFKIKESIFFWSIIRLRKAIYTRYFKCFCFEDIVKIGMRCVIVARDKGLPCCHENGNDFFFKNTVSDVDRNWNLEFGQYKVQSKRLNVPTWRLQSTSLFADSMYCCQVLKMYEILV